MNSTSQSCNKAERLPLISFHPGTVGPAWRALRDSIGADYRDLIDSLMRDTPVQPLRHHAAMLRQYIAEEPRMQAGKRKPENWRSAEPG